MLKALSRVSVICLSSWLVEARAALITSWLSRVTGTPILAECYVIMSLSCLKNIK